MNDKTAEQLRALSNALERNGNGKKCGYTFADLASAIASLNRYDIGQKHLEDDISITSVVPDSRGKFVRLSDIEELINTRVPDAEAVAWQYRNVTEEGPSPFWHNIDKASFDTFRNDRHAEVRPLFTHPSATALDVRDAERWATFKRYVSETIGGNALLDRLAILDISSWDQCIDELQAAIASQGEGK